MATAAAAKSGPKEFTFIYEGKDKGGKTLKGEMRAAGDHIVLAQLRRQGLQSVSVKKVSSRGGKSITEKDITIIDSFEAVGGVLDGGLLGQVVQRALRRAVVRLLHRCRADVAEHRGDACGIGRRCDRRATAE